MKFLIDRASEWLPMLRHVRKWRNYCDVYFTEVEDEHDVD